MAPYQPGPAPRGRSKTSLGFSPAGTRQLRWDLSVCSAEPGPAGGLNLQDKLVNDAEQL